MIKSARDAFPCNISRCCTEKNVFKSILLFYFRNRQQTITLNNNTRWMIFFIDVWHWYFNRLRSILNLYCMQLRWRHRAWMTDEGSGMTVDMPWYPLLKAQAASSESPVNWKIENTFRLVPFGEIIFGTFVRCYLYSSENSCTWACRWWEEMRIHTC